MHEIEDNDRIDSKIDQGQEQRKASATMKTESSSTRIGGESLGPIDEFHCEGEKPRGRTQGGGSEDPRTGTAMRDRLRFLRRDPFVRQGGRKFAKFGTQIRGRRSRGKESEIGVTRSNFKQYRDGVYYMAEGMKTGQTSDRDDLV